jgi:cytochrome c oxidase cbb3-type subunit III
MITFVMAALLGMILQGAPQQTPPPPAQPAAADAAHGGQQATPPPAAGARGGRAGQAPAGGGGGFANAFPQHAAPDAAAVERGKAVWGVNCTFCHGADARGGSGGPSLIRSSIVINDQNGELITPIVQNGIGDKMPKLSLTAAQVTDIAAFLHSFRVSGYDTARQRPLSIVVGDAKAGEAYFQAKCASCHSPTGDLKGLAAKFSDPRTLQQYWLMPGGGGRGGAAASGPAATTVTVTLASGQKVEGRLLRIDDFLVTLAGADGAQRTFRRDGDTPKVDVHDPLQPHKALLPVYTDKNIHDLTAFLVNLK